MREEEQEKKGGTCALCNLMWLWRACMSHQQTRILWSLACISATTSFQRTFAWRDANFQMLQLNIKNKEIIPNCIFCMSLQSPSPSHLSIAYETWYWPIHILCLCIPHQVLPIPVNVFPWWYQKGNCIHLSSNSHSKWNGLYIGSNHHEMLLCSRRQKTPATMMKNRKRRGGQENFQEKI